MRVREKYTAGTRLHLSEVKIFCYIRNSCNTSFTS